MQSSSPLLTHTLTPSHTHIRHHTHTHTTRRPQPFRFTSRPDLSYLIWSFLPAISLPPAAADKSMQGGEEWGTHTHKHTHTHTHTYTHTHNTHTHTSTLMHTGMYTSIHTSTTMFAQRDKKHSHAWRTWRCFREIFLLDWSLLPSQHFARLFAKFHVSNEQQWAAFHHYQAKKFLCN